jgi:two-component sensor histidine kinase
MFTHLGSLIGQVSDRKRYIALTAISATILVGLFDYIIDSEMSAHGLDIDFHAGLQGAIVGLGAGALLLVVLLGTRTRRQLVTEELRRLAELNHTVRNSLEVIIMAHHFQSEDAHNKIVLECTRKIDEKLKQLFPVVGLDLRRKKRS